jgi:hypothetical protein
MAAFSTRSTAVSPVTRLLARARSYANVVTDYLELSLAILRERDTFVQRVLDADATAF